MIELSGEKKVGQAKDKVLDFLSDPNLLSSCLGNVENLHSEKDGNFVARFKIAVPKKFGVSYMENVNATMNFKLSRLPDAVEWKGSGRTVGVKLIIVLRLETRDEDSGTKLCWHASMNAGVIEKLLGDQNLREIANDMANQILECVSTRIM